MSLFTCCFYPKKEAIKEGARPLAIAIEAANQKFATAVITLRFAEDYPAATNQYFAPKIFMFAPGLPCADKDTWSDTFLDSYLWDKTYKCLVAIEPAAAANDEDSEQKKSEPTDTIESHKLPFNTEISHFWLGGMFTATKEEQKAARLAAMDTDNSYLQNVLLSLNSVESCKHCFNSVTNSLIASIQEVWPLSGKAPDLGLLRGFVIEWMAAINDQSSNDDKPHRESVTKKWVARYNKPKTPSGATAGGGNVTDRSPTHKHDFDSLMREIALGLVGRAMDFDIYNLQSGIVNRARDMIKLKEKPLMEWFEVMRLAPGILNFSRAMTIFTVKTAPDTIHQDPAALLSYINRTMTESDHAHPKAEIIAAACGLQPAEYEKKEDEPKSDMAGEIKPEESGVDGEVRPEEPKPEEPKPEPIKAVAKVKNTKPKKVEELQQPVIPAPAVGEDKTDAAPSNEVEKAEEVQNQPEAQVFQSIGAALEKDLAEKGDNLKIWRSVMRTDPRYTKDLAGVGFEGTSINAEYMIMRATEIFGPIGTGWGFEVLEDRMIPGAPMSEAIYEDKKFIGNRMLRDGDGTLITELNHSIKITFWYLNETGAAERFEAYGATPYMYKTKSGIRCDGEVHKKSLTDAIKKALSLLGFSADVWLGLYDQAEYKQENAIEFDIRNASDKAEDVTRIRKELDEKFKLNTDSMRSAVTPNEISGIASSLTRVMAVHLKAAREKADLEYTKYLEGRLRRLEEVKTECLTKLQEQAA